MALNTEENKVREYVVNLSTDELGEIVRTCPPFIETLKTIERNHSEDRSGGWMKWMNMFYNSSHEELVTRAKIGDEDDGK